MSNNNSKKGVILVNLGSPKSTLVKDVKAYLDEFLMDKFVIDMPYLLRAFIVKGIILNTRPKKSAKAYQRIWTKEGSPLIVLSKKLQNKVQKNVDIPVGLAMRYGQPSIKSSLKYFHQKEINDVLLIPMYPQYAMATTKTIEELSKTLIKKYFPEVKLTFLPPFYNDENYIKALATSLENSLQTFNPDYILFSYHGVPERHIYKTDVTKSHCKIDGLCCHTPSEAHKFCYRHQCLQTTKNIANALNLKEDTYSNSFQSRLGTDKWLQPYTDKTIIELAQKGIKKLAIITPAFVTDCLETLEEIAIEGAHLFKENGGEDFLTIPCLNDNDQWSMTISQWINDWESKK